jgi:PRC-barrel domain protein
MSTLLHRRPGTTYRIAVAARRGIGSVGTMTAGAVGSQGIALLKSSLRGLGCSRDAAGRTKNVTRFRLPTPLAHARLDRPAPRVRDVQRIGSLMECPNRPPLNAATDSRADILPGVLGRARHENRPLERLFAPARQTQLSAIAMASDQMARAMASDQMARTGQTDETDRLISSDKVDGTTVYKRNAENLGSIDHLTIDKFTGQVEYAVMSVRLPRHGRELQPDTVGLARI